MEEKDIVIIGAGPAGYVAAARASRLKRKVTLIEKDSVGGTCLNRGCIPTRTLVRAVDLFDVAKKAKDYGIETGPVSFNMATAKGRCDVITRTVVGGVEYLMKGNGVEVIKGRARFLSPSTVEVQAADGTSRQLSAQKVVIATGATWQKPAIPGHDLLIGADQALQFKEVPRSIVILGAWAIGLTFASLFGRIGTNVTVVEPSTQILPGFDREITGMLEKELKKTKVQFNYETTLVSMSAGPGDDKTVKLSAKGQETTVTAQYVMLADQRGANTEGLALEAIGVKMAGGSIEVNDRMETSVAGVYAAGDVVGGLKLAHVAFAAGIVAAENAAGKSKQMDYSVIPQCVSTAPEVAMVGLTEDQVLAQGRKLRIGRFPMAACGMATLSGERIGVVKVISDAAGGPVLGVHILGSNASNLIAEAALAMKLKADAAQIANTIHAHPTLPEALFEASLDVNGDTLHMISANR